MIKEAMQYIVEMKEPNIKTINGETYSDRPLIRVSHNPMADSIKMSTLTSLVDYIKAGIDEMSDKMIVQVVGPLEVRLISMLDPDRKREALVHVNGRVPDFYFDHYMDSETFLIALQSKFIQNEDRESLLRFAGTVENGTVAKYGDDGVTQKATVKTGVASKGDCLLPNPVNLIPYRTFVEIEQPESSFVFRMRNDGSHGVECAIFEADGGAWVHQAMSRIKDYLADELDRYDKFTVIA